jgi:hypothetical protein
MKWADLATKVISVTSFECAAVNKCRSNTFDREANRLSGSREVPMGNYPIFRFCAPEVIQRGFHSVMLQVDGFSWIFDAAGGRLATNLAHQVFSRVRLAQRA